ncbi:MAG TPA: thiamine pyrophosphate-dependent enzyme [Candidatus Limnocylindrales bacterium]|nr:thiamine pyrophosphate-dependent enzyme [Candidatus Limnocylindrales bacterium]
MTAEDLATPEHTTPDPVPGPPAGLDEVEHAPPAAPGDEPEEAPPAEAPGDEPEEGPPAEAPNDEPEEPVAAAEDAAPVPAVAMPTTVAGLVAATLRAAGVRIAFTVPGESFLAVLDALAEHGVRIVATRHEGAAAFAAEAYGQLTGRPAVCLGTRAVGAANLAIGIHTARADSTPMFAIVGQVVRGARGREAFQESDVVGTVGGFAIWAVELDDPRTAADQLAEAVSRATGGRPGPVVLSIPEDVQTLPLPPGTTLPAVRAQPSRPEPEDVRAVLHALAGARRPVILAGAGVLRARCSNDLARLAEVLQVPVIASWRRPDVISNDSPFYLGMTGLGAPPSVRERLEDADLIVVLGSRLSEPTTFDDRIPAPGQRWIHVDIDPQAEPRGSRPAPELTVRADAKAFVRAALARLRNAVLLADPIAWRQGHNATDRAAYEAATIVDVGAWSGPGVHPGRVVTALRRLLPDDAIVTTDAGNFATWAARGFRFRRPGTFLGPTSGAMGYGLPAAIAAALVHRDRPVVALVGDGGLAMTLAELETAVREQARIVVLCFDNERYGTIRMHQEREAAGTHATDLGRIDFAAVARACGARGVRVESDDAFEPALRAALVADRLTLLHLQLDRAWVSASEPAMS